MPTVKGRRVHLLVSQGFLETATRLVAAGCGGLRGHAASVVLLDTGCEWLLKVTDRNLVEGEPAHRSAGCFKCSHCGCSFLKTEYSSHLLHWAGLKLYTCLLVAVLVFFRALDCEPRSYAESEPYPVHLYEAL